MSTRLAGVWRAGGGFGPALTDRVRANGRNIGNGQPTEATPYRNSATSLPSRKTTTRTTPASARRDLAPSAPAYCTVRAPRAFSLKSS